MLSTGGRSAEPEPGGRGSTASVAQADDGSPQKPVSTPAPGFLRILLLMLLLGGLTAAWFIVSLELGILLSGQAVLLTSPVGAEKVAPLSGPTVENVGGESHFTLTVTLPLSLRNLSAAPSYYYLDEIYYYLEDRVGEEECLLKPASAPAVPRGLEEADLQTESSDLDVFVTFNSSALARFLSAPAVNRRGVLSSQGDNFDYRYRALQDTMEENQSKMFSPASVTSLSHSTRKPGEPQESSAKSDPSFAANSSVYVLDMGGPPPQLMAYVGPLGTTNVTMDVSLSTKLAPDSPVPELVERSCAQLGYVVLGAQFWRPRSAITRITPWNPTQARDISLTTSWQVLCGA